MHEANVVPAGYVSEQLSAAEGRQLLEAMNPNPRRAGPSSSAKNDFTGGEVCTSVLRAISMLNCLLL